LESNTSKVLENRLEPQKNSSRAKTEFSVERFCFNCVTKPCSAFHSYSDWYETRMFVVMVTKTRHFIISEAGELISHLHIMCLETSCVCACNYIHKSLSNGILTDVFLLKFCMHLFPLFLL